MPKAKKPKSGRGGAGEPPEPRSRFGTVLKWVGGTTAVLSLVFGLRQLTVLISDARDRQRQVTELTRELAILRADMERSPTAE